MELNPILLAVWAVLAACFVGLLVYRGHLTRYEEDQLFLNDSIHQDQHQTHDKIIRRIHMLQPVVRGLGGAAAVTTACVVGIYVWKAWQTIH